MAKTQVKFSILEKAKSWIQKNRLEAVVLLSILLLGAFFRLYRIDQYMTFLGDEGRDVIVVRRLLVDFDPILVGPGTSIGNMYLGPLYYYMMAPALLLANFSPVGPAAMIALLGIATIFFVWFVAREWFGKFAAVVASLLYAITPVIITYSRSSWNPNIMPFFALLTIYSIWQFWSPYANTGRQAEGSKRFRWLIVAGISMAFVLQSHYLGLLLIPTLGFFWLLTFVKVKGERQKVKEFIKQSIVGGFLFLLLMSPLVIFDARHGWRNFEAIKVFFTQRQTTVSARPWTALPKLWPLMQKVSARLITGNSELAGSIAAKIIPILSFGAVLTSFYKSKFKKDKKANRRLRAYLLLAVWVGVAMIGLGVYKQEIYDHYYGFFFAAPFLLLGGISEGLIKYAKQAGLVAVVLMVGWLSYVNLVNNPLKYHPNRQLQRTKEVARAVVEYSEGEPFNFAVIAERNYEGAYMYFLEMWGAPAMIPIADILDETLTEQLFVVCEVKGERCNPETNERPELTNFGWRKIVAQWDVAGVTVSKLIHSK
jgi:4-amino-4-deoxy-L-arabinose transferase-like glycosyltransferase